MPLKSPPPQVANAFDAMPETTRRRAMELRALIAEVADTSGIPALEETLKWGEPAYLPGRGGTTVRIGWDRDSGDCKLLVHCGTSLVEGWRCHIGDRLSYDGNRAVRIGATDWFDKPALSACIADALTYHTDTRRTAHG